MDASSGQLLEMQNNTLQNMLECSKTQQDRKPRPEPEQALKCPRCESTNTKFCYYNNYSLSQPRYFCKSCRRYWTKGGTLRNVPVGGGCRKNKRSSSTTQKRIQDQSLVNSPSNPPLTGIQTFGGYDSNDLALAFAALQQKQCQQQLGYEEHDVSIFRHQKCDIPGNHNVHTHTTTSVGNTGFLDALRSGYLDNQNGSRNLFSNYGGNIGDVNSNSTHGSIAEMVLPYDQEISTTAKTTAVTVETVKQEMCDVARESENKVLWGFPWQLNGDENMSDVAASSWHGLINSPLPLM